MITEIDDGGPAFPSPALPHATDGRAEARDGMTLRDYFAGQALQFLLREIQGYSPDFIATRAYEMADAMIAARKAKS